MSRQAAAERFRRSAVLEAEGRKRALELDSEGDKIRLINEAEGRRVQVENESDAASYKLRVEAEGEASSIITKANAQAHAIATISTSLQVSGANDAARMQIANRYIDMYSDIGQKSNTMIFNDRPGKYLFVFFSFTANPSIPSLEPWFIVQYLSIRSTSHHISPQLPLFPFHRPFS